MPQGQRRAVSQAQQMMMGADLARMRAGKRTKTGMDESQLREFAGTRRKGLPRRAKAVRPTQNPFRGVRRAK